MILKLISLFVVVLAVRLMLDKIGAYFPDKCQMYITYLMLFLSDFLIKIAMLFLVVVTFYRPKSTQAPCRIYPYRPNLDHIQALLFVP